MTTVEELNDLRQRGQWEELGVKSREVLTENPNSEVALRGVIQTLEKIGDKEDEYEAALIRLLDLKSRSQETAQKLAEFYKEKDQMDEAIKHYELSIEAAIEDRHYKALDDLWMELLELEPEKIDFFIRMTDLLHEQKHSPKASALLQMLLPSCDDRQDWKGRLDIYRKIYEYTPDDETLRQAFIDSYQKMYGDSPLFERVIQHTGINEKRPLPDALNELESLVMFLPDRYVLHPDWGVGRVKELDMITRRLTINFQKKRGHRMGLDLAQSALERLEPDDFRVLAVVGKDKLEAMKNDDPVGLVKIVLKSFGGSLNGKQMKEYMVPAVMADRHWTSWWSNVNSLLRKDPYIAVSSGANKQYTLRSEALSEEDDVLKKFDATKAPHARVDRMYDYLRTTRRTDLNDAIVQHFSKRLKSMIQRRKGAVERVELWFANEDLKGYADGIESADYAVLDEIIADLERAKSILRRLRFKTHQWRFAQRIAEIQPEEWPRAYYDLLLAPNVSVRDDIARALNEAGHESLIQEMIEQALQNYRETPHTFIWLADNQLSEKNDWLASRISNPVLIERLLLLTDFLTSQAKRREREEALELRAVAADAREIIRRAHYALFKKHIAEADEALAAGIYRRSQANEGLDSRTSSDLTTIIRARFPNLMQTSTLQEDVPIPEGLLCLRETLDVKKALLKRLVEIELPQVVQEIDTARQQGDLRENAEYQAAKEKQRLLASQTGELQEQLQIAKQVELDEITGDVIGFGVRFVIQAVGADATDEYFMLGPWESDPDNHIISYQAPFAMAFMGKKQGEQVEVELPQHTGRYEVRIVEKISPETMRSIIERIKPVIAAAAIDDEDDEPALES
ncbi:MAG: hypothetical protein GC154_08640 [bacterium]|nr:hypothetical protein [bacterium]